MFATYKNKKPESKEEELQHELQHLVCQGIADMLGIMYDQRGKGDGVGKYSQPISQARQALLSSVVANVPKGKVSAVARMLETNRKQLEACRAIYQEYRDRKRTAPYNEPKSYNCYPVEYERCVIKLWKAGTRLSEKKKDTVSNPHNKSDQKQYRIRYLNQTIPHLCDWMNQQGRLELQDPNFQVS